MRALTFVATGWIGLRALMLWPVPDAPVAEALPNLLSPPAPALIVAAAPTAAAKDTPTLTPARTVGGFPRALVVPSRRVEWTGKLAQHAWLQPGASASEPQRTSVRPADSTVPLAAATAAKPARWSGSAWAIGRGGGSGSIGTATQLGGSQAGVRGFYDLGRSIAATGRVSTSFSREASREASIGVAWRSGAVGILAERRVRLDTGDGDFMLTAYGGRSDIALPGRLRLDTYVQAGVAGSSAFVDGAVRVERTVIERGGRRLSAGAGLWGGAQPGAARLDVGPQLVAVLPLVGRNLRLAAEWRQRVAGNASPASGPAVSMGVDF